jgi:beta-lactamase regulating signal transducer with metallopeptidase domain
VTIPTLFSDIIALPASNMSMLIFLGKATIILVVALGITFAMQRASAGARHLVWLVTLGTLLLVPALTAWSPLRFAILPPVREPSLEAVSAIGTPAQSPAVSSSARDLAQSPGTGTSQIIAAADPGTASPTNGLLSRIEGLSGFSALLAIWAAVVLVLAGWLTYGALVVRGIVRRARPLDTKDWLAPLWEVSDRFALDNPPRLLRSEDAKMPFACGLLQPTIVLPAECDNWTADRRLAVLLHELAHVRRHDLVGHTLGRLTCALYWFHPLVWTAAKQLRAESERACDDLALACGARASDYAEHLLDIVTSVRHDSTPAVALAMARRKEFEGRMLAILDPELRHSSPTRWQSAAVIGSLAIVSIVVGAAAPAPRPDQQGPPGAPAVSSVDGNAAKIAQPATPKTRPAPQYPDSGIRGVASTAQRMIEKATQFTQTLTDTRTVENRSTNVAIDDKSTDLAGDNAARAVEHMLEKKGGGTTAQARSDDRPVLLANVLRNDTSASLRRIAAWGLSEYAETQVAVDALAAALRRDSNASVREMAAWALAQGDDGIPVAIESLSAALRGDSNAKVRATAAWALGHVGDRNSADVLSAALGDADRQVRMRAAWALGQVDLKQAPAPLVAMLRDSEPHVRELAAWALYEIQDPAAVPALDAALRAESDKNLQLAYIRALAATGEKSVDAVRRLLESKDPQIRTMAVRALAGGNAAGPWPWPWPDPRPFP